MARFFFDFRQAGRFEPDQVGVEYSSTEAAYLAAIEAAQEMWSELLAARHDPRSCAFEIRDDRGALLFEIPFGELLEACHRSKDPMHSLSATMAQAKAIHDFAVMTRTALSDELRTTHRALRESKELMRKVI